MKTKTRFILIIILLAFSGIFFIGSDEALCRSSTKAASLLKKADQCRNRLYHSAKKRKYRHYWLNCINRYKKIYAGYPKTDQAGWAIYHSGRLYTRLYTYSGRSKDLDEAILLFRRLADDYKDHRLADDAQYLIGEIFYKYKKNISQAYVEFLRVDIKYPSGDMRPKAKKMLDRLALVLSKNDEQKDSTGLASSASKLSAVNEIRHWSTPNYTRVVIDLSSPVTYKYHLLRPDPDRKKPRRLYLDLDNARVSAQINTTVSIKDGLLQMARAAQYTNYCVRVVLDMGSIGGYKIFHLYDPFRIVVDVRKKAEEKSKPNRLSLAHKKRLPAKGIKKAASPKNKVSLAKQLGLNVKRIVIDPGHGGKDPGCIGPGGIKEKDIVLNIAKFLAQKIKKEIGCKVFLTRTKDVFLSLEQRTAIANMKKADLFISLHVNAHRNRRILGLETYYLNMATDERAVMVAARENATSKKNISDLQTILNDLMLNTKINESSRLAYSVQKGIISNLKARRYNPVKNLGVKQAPFYVLIGAEMPAILVETGFLTNRTERRRLVKKRYEERVAEGISTGIKNYIESIDEVYQGG